MPRPILSARCPRSRDPYGRDSPSQPKGSSRSSVPLGSRRGLAHGTCHELRHTCFTRLREAGMAALRPSRPRPATARSNRPAFTSTSATAGWPTSTPRPWSPPGTGGGRPMSALPEGSRGPVAAVEPDRIPLGRDRPPGRPSWWPPWPPTWINSACRPVGATVGATEQGLRHFAGQVTQADSECTSMAAVEPRATSKRTSSGSPLDPARPEKALGQGDDPAPPRLGTHILQAPARLGLRRRSDQDADLPRRLPTGRRAVAKRFLDDPTMEKFTAALASGPDPRRRRQTEVLYETGINVGELSRTRRQGRDLARRHARCASRSATAQRPLRADRT